MCFLYHNRYVKNTILTGKAAKLLGVAVKMVQRWEREGRLIAIARTDGKRRLYAEE
jgi:DNA-binding transcriptional MerR regulator